LLCIPFSSKLLDTIWLHFVAVVNFIIIADKFRKKKISCSIQKCSSSRLLSNMSYVRPKQTQYAYNYILLRLSVKTWYLIMRGKSNLRVFENRVLRRICESESWRSCRVQAVSQ